MCDWIIKKLKHTSSHSSEVCDWMADQLSAANKFTTFQISSYCGMSFVAVKVKVLADPKQVEIHFISSRT